MRFFRTFSMVLATAVVSACTGSGTSGTEKIINEVQAANPDSIFVYRDTGFSGSGALMQVLLNGEDQGTIGIKESLELEVPRGLNEIEIRYTGLAALTTPDKLQFENDGNKANYFIISQKHSFLSAEIILVETTAQSYVSQVQ